MTFRASVDGASRGNPGPSGAGAFIEAAPGHPAEELFEALGSPDKRMHVHPGMHGEVPAEEFEASRHILAAHLVG